MNKISKKIYYVMKKFIPRKVQIGLRRKIAENIRKRNLDWPINENFGHAPENWNGWPEDKKFALVLTHDVDTLRGYENCINLLNLEKEKGFISSFNFVPQKYGNTEDIRRQVEKEGFEVGVHGLNHDGKLYWSKEIFNCRAKKINEYLKKWKSDGFRSPSMHHNLEWISNLDILYDTSTFDFDPFEPQSDGVETIFPFNVKVGARKYVELPYTLPQDFTMFVMLKEKGIDIWKKKLDWIVKKGGMALINVHPDYINFTNKVEKMEQYPAKYYGDFLDYVSSEYHGEYWHALPREIAKFTKEFENQKV